MKRSIFCRICKKLGHSLENCYFNENNRGNKSHDKTKANNDNKSRDNYCIIYSSNTHNTEECRYALQARDQVNNKQSSHIQNEDNKKKAHTIKFSSH